MMAETTGKEKSVPRSKKCRAKSKQSGKQCARWATPGKTLCVIHGSKKEGVPALERITHGQTSKFYSEEEVDKLLKYRRELDSIDGQAEALKDNYAKIKAREERIPAAVDFTELAIKAADSKRKDILAIHELTDEKPVAPTTFVLNNFDPQQHAAFQARTIDGPCQIRYLDGEPFMLEGRCWVPAHKQVDDDSGAEYYVRLLEG